ncbi:MAG: hypothetical protein VYB05_03150, partial [Pseudomonadota bacterium]|nr:hypothetical protein [Pseudomonadota bacterium]
MSENLQPIFGNGPSSCSDRTVTASPFFSISQFVVTLAMAGEITISDLCSDDLMEQRLPIIKGDTSRMKGVPLIQVGVCQV